LTSFKIGGPAEYFFEPQNFKELQQALVLCRRFRIPVHILGAGSNLLIADAGLKGLVIRLSNENFRKCSLKGDCIVAGSGIKLNALILFSREHNRSGLEFLAGIPGTLGGGLSGNAGAWGYSIGSLVARAGVLDYAGKFNILPKKRLVFGYRKSNLNKQIILWAELETRRAAKTEVSRNLKEVILKRKASQGDHLPNAGCVFKNPEQASAGKLIDACGLKGKARGKAVISCRHANFILNRGKAKSGDVLALMELMRKKVKDRFKLQLEPEIRIWK